MPINKQTVEYIAHLSRIELAQEELGKLSRQLEAILDFIDKLKELNIEGIQPTSHILALDNIFREDKLRASLSNEDTLLNTPAKRNGFFVVPKVIE